MASEWIHLYKLYLDSSCLDHAIYHIMYAQKIIEEIENGKICNCN